MYEWAEKEGKAVVVSGQNAKNHKYCEEEYSEKSEEEPDRMCKCGNLYTLPKRPLAFALLKNGGTHISVEDRRRGSKRTSSQVFTKNSFKVCQSITAMYS